MVLIQNGLITTEQWQAAQRYGRENNRDLRQSILELNLISPERLNALAFERLTALAEHNGLGIIRREERVSPLLPDRAKLQRDMRNELKELAATATLPNLVAQILERACEARATDIHFDPQESGLRVRFRIDGQLQDVLDLEAGMTTAVISRIKVMSNLNIVERRHSQDGRITIQHLNRPRDLRVATFPTALGEKIVIRIHEMLTDAHSFERLGLTPKQQETLERLIARPYGAVLVAGPVGSGKTTTLYSCLGKVNSPTRNVMTIEDPIEYRIAGANQTQVDTRAEMGFSEGLRAMLRQDPDVIMIGEIRDDETAKIGIRAALTGVLVFSSIHASDSASTIGNLYNFGIPGYQLSSSLLGIISQRLIRKVCPYCRITYPADAKMMAALELDPHEHPGVTLHRGLGCAACFQTGYSGRTGIFEIMEANEELRELIFQQIPKDVLRRVAIDMGMQTLKSSAVDKILDGTTTVEEAYRVVSM
jgi:type IV pilus assembly protein PilB